MNDTIVAMSKGHTVYKLLDGTRVPGVTTVLGVLAKPALIAWANRMGLRGIDTSKYVRDAATAGTVAHYLIECDLKGIKADTSQFAPALVDLGENGYLKWLEWKRGKDIRLVLSEEPMVSETFRYGGTPDAIVYLDGVLSLLDFKTSDSGIWPEMRHQVAAYDNLVKEHQIPVERDIIIRLGKEDCAGFETETVADIPLHFKMFRFALDIYDLQKQLKKGER